MVDVMLRPEGWPALPIGALPAEGGPQGRGQGGGRAGSTARRRRFRASAGALTEAMAEAPGAGGRRAGRRAPRRRSGQMWDEAALAGELRELLAGDAWLAEELDQRLRRIIEARPSPASGR